MSVILNRQFRSSGSVKYTFGSGARSVYGGAGGSKTRISRANFSAGMLDVSASTCGDAKFSMQNLNDRLAAYLAQVNNLEAANRKLELQIKEYLEKRSPAQTRDYTKYLTVISDLRAQILTQRAQRQGLILQLDNARLAAEDFNMKYESELSMRGQVEVDIARLRMVMDSLTLSRSSLETQLEGQKEELIYMKKNQEEELSQLRACRSDVNVEVDCTQSQNLTKVLGELRLQYEAMVQQNQQEVEGWYQIQVKSLECGIGIVTQEVNTSRSELTELRRSMQSLEIELQACMSNKLNAEQSLAEVSRRYNMLLAQLQLLVDGLQGEKNALVTSIHTQSLDLQQLLDIRTRLEMEIAEYRRLLGGEAPRPVIVTVEKELEVAEEHKPHIERHVKTITEEIVDGKVVSSTVDTQVLNIQ